MPDQQHQPCPEHDPLHCSCDEKRDRTSGVHRASGLSDAFGGYMCVCGGGSYSVTYGCLASIEEASSRDET